VEAVDGDAAAGETPCELVREEDIAVYCVPMRVHLVDGTFELFRAHHSKRPRHVAPAGWDAKATVGLAVSLLALLHEERESVTHIAVAFDNPIRSFRNDLWSGYKTDEGVPPELLAQFDAAEEATRSLGVTVWSMREFEADDALATGAARFRDAVDQVRILTPDKDLGQCLVGRRVVQLDRIRNREIDEEALLARRGIRPGSVPDYLALVGDDADGIPGLPGFGQKTASALLARYLHLEDIPRDPALWPTSIRGAAQLARELGSGREAALLYRRLATLVDDVPLPESLEDLRWRGIPRDRFEAWCAELGARALLAPLEARPARWAA
jgi:5'-3' exonuclease